MTSFIAPERAFNSFLLVEYMTHGTPVEQTINECKDLIQFQKVVKLSDSYKWVEHEHGTPECSDTLI